MEYSDILTLVQEIFRNVFNDDNLVIGDSTSAKDIKSWDSLNHVILIAEVEEQFHVKFDLSDMLDIRTAGDICQAILRLKSKS